MKNVIQKGVVSRTLAHTHFAPKRKVLFSIIILLLTNLSIAQSGLGSNDNGSSVLGTQNNEPLKFITNANERMRLTTSGKLGIGITDPIRTLEVNGDAGFNGALYLTDLENSSSINQTVFTTQLLTLNNSKVVKTSLEDLRTMMYMAPPVFNSCNLAGQPIQQNPAWYSNPFKLYTICPDILVGIGTDNPEYTLDVNGNANFRENLFSYRLRVGQKDEGSGLISGYWKGNDASSYELLNLGFSSSQTQASHQILTIDVKGNLRLNNRERDIFYIDAATETVKARNIIVDEQNWPDYVFKKEYSLLPLKKVQAYIEENGHLPNVPSANEVAEQGLSLGGMTKVTMEKIEELTLYLLQINERLEQQEVNLVEQQNLIDEQAKLIQLQQLMIEQLKIDNE